MNRSSLAAPPGALLLLFLFSFLFNAASAATLAAGGSHTCAVAEGAGEIRCWGLGSSGQLGNGKLESRAAPTVVSSSVRRWIAVETGAEHSCGLTADGGVQCWGAGNYGQLGNGSTANRSLATNVSGLASGVTAIALGSSHSCALLQTGRVNCWGHGGYGRLGSGNVNNQTTPSEVQGLDDVIAIAAGYEHTCALLNDRTVKCWGRNATGAIGDGTFVDRFQPVFAANLNNIAAISIGAYHSCARSLAGAVRCWGFNAQGQIGDGTLINRPSSVAVPNLQNGVLQVIAGGYHSCALRTGLPVQCWGLNDYGQLGDETRINRSAPTDIPNLPITAFELSGGSQHTCARASGNNLYCWGRAEDGRIGFGNSTAPENSSRPRRVSGLRAAPVKLSLLAATACAVTEVGSAHCWGVNDFGQIGEGNAYSSSGPRDVASLQSAVTDIAVGEKHSCAIQSSGAAWCWGRNTDGQLGDATNLDRYSRVAVIGMNDSVQIATGQAFSCTRTAVGGVWCWGDNVYGQLGNGGGADRNQATPVTGLDSGVVAIALGHEHACALKNDAKVVCWGHNQAGQLGDSSTVDKALPTPIDDAFDDYVAISAGEAFSCGLTTTDKVKCWGSNSTGQLGDGSTMQRPNPAQVQTLTNGVTQIATGDRHACALRNGTLYCWGLNDRYQLGDTTTTMRLIPVVAQNMPAAVQSFALGASASCAVFSDRIGRCWGANGYGQAGNGGVPTGGIPLPEPISHWLRDDLIFRHDFELR